MNKQIEIFEEKGQLWTSSLAVAKKFNKSHREVLKKCDGIKDDCPGDFMRNNFVLDSYKDSRGNTQRIVKMTLDGFTLSVMAFTGKRALGFKVEYIEEFNRKGRNERQRPIK